MARYRFGDGRYRYFDHPLPDAIAELRGAFYRHLAPIANDWSEPARGRRRRLPARARRAARALPRRRPGAADAADPALRRQGDWNALHQDLYGDVFFPFQVLTVLSEPGVDYEGGEFVLLEQRPRAQSRAHVVTAPRGAFVVFPTHHRPQQGARGYYKVGLRHGVSTITRGSRTALGIIFHDAS